MGLSKIDLKVLRFVCDNGAQLPLLDTAKELRLKPSTVAYSLKKMRREHVILRYHYRLNYHRLGFPAVAWVLFKLKGASIAYGAGAEEVMREFFGKLLSFPQVHVVSFITGAPDIALKLIERDPVSINALVLKITSEMRDMLDSPQVMFSTKVYKTHNVVLEKTDPFKGLDATDFEILNYKMHHPDAELREAASKLGLHRNTVSKRWRTFWKEKILLKETPVLNPDFYDELGFGLKAIIFLDIAANHLQGVVETLTKMPEVHELNQLLSGHDLMAIIRVKNVPALFDFLKRLYTTVAIKQTSSHVVLYSQPHKPNYLLELSKAGILPFKIRFSEK